MKNNYENLRPADLIAKVAKVSLREAIRVLAALDLVAEHLEEHPETLLRDNSLVYPDEGHAKACDEAFGDLHEGPRGQDILWIRSMR